MNTQFPGHDPDEQLVLEIQRANVPMLLLGIFACFVPPFIFGPIILIFYYIEFKKTAVYMTTKRVVLLNKRRGEVEESILIENIRSVSRKALSEMEMGVVNKFLFRASPLAFWEIGKATPQLQISGVKKAKKVMKQLREINPRINCEWRKGEVASADETATPK